MNARATPASETAVGAGTASPAAKAGNGLRPELQRADDFISRVISVVESIPSGRVMAYGDVAAAIGSRAARAVGHVMSHYGEDLPWWRVIRASGQPPACHDSEALPHYEEEGTPLLPTAGGYRINLRLARHHP